MQPRSLAISRGWKNLDPASVFSVWIYPALGVVLLTAMLIVGALVADIGLKWYYAPLAIGGVLLSIYICNVGIGPLHRVIQHRAGELSRPGQIIVMLHCIYAMQGRIKDWVNYHSQHHRFADQPGDPHNPFESKRWAWFGWILWRDRRDTDRPFPIWMSDQKIVRFLDHQYNLVSIIMHFIVPAIVYLIVWLAGGSLVLTGIIHASLVIGRAVQFHATTLGINVMGHLKTPLWADHFMALLTGGEAYHDHHHDEPVSALHLPRKGLFNRIFDYNGTTLLIWEKLGLVKNLKIAQQFA